VFVKDKNLFTQADLVEAIKEVGVATKSDLQKLERSLKQRMGQDRNKILSAIGNLATHTPTLSSFNELKAKVDRVITTS